MESKTVIAQKYMYSFGIIFNRFTNMIVLLFINITISTIVMVKISLPLSSSNVGTYVCFIY